MKRKILSLMLAAALVLGLAMPALAYTTPDFTDVPSNHWAYQSVMKMADAGVIKGTGNGQFSPEMKLSAEMFVVLVGRVVFPDVKAEGADWSGPYVTEAKAKGLLEGTNITDSNLTGDISRYDMAVILARAAKWKNLKVAKVDQSAVKDYGEVPTKYADAVLTVYGAGLIKGDQAGNFNGANSMTRQEAATVMDRLLGLIPGGTTTEPDSEKPVESADDPLVQYEFRADLRQTEHAMAAPAFDKHTYLPNVSAKLYYTPDSGKTSTLVAEGVSVAEDRWIDENNKELQGAVTFQFEAPKTWGQGKNFYVSAETVYEGQELVTSDLRTDGRAYKSLFSISPVAEQLVPFIQHTYVEFTPPTGEKARLTYKGTVSCRTSAGERFPEGFTVQLHFKDGTVLGKAVTDANGYFTMDFEVDALDNPFDPMINQYYVTLDGVMDGNHYAYTPIRDGQVVLTSFYVLKICIPRGSSGEWENEDVSIHFSLSNVVAP